MSCFLIFLLFTRFIFSMSLLLIILPFAPPTNTWKVQTFGLSPHAVAIPSKGEGFVQLTTGKRLYWSNVYPGHAGLFRCLQDGSLLEPLLLGRERIYDILVLPIEFGGEDVFKDVVLYLDAQR